ncbi:H-NS histone family protein [Pseudooctadecabacter jejudonensis]|uniref:DNA binding protein, nucleoid-associated n=1 Tax=Pseudooctadecabacter jejudonensis TaxID=1391910 RepID=A0A1Y5RVB1_9RHOB|nr:H-NS histone family protein [Pseudooctadecabacter jejudonensis]SLN26356.1 DNA binding protein, nucleoid-associated [Pseudooctadecabacter jejudonensis]
MAIDLKSMSKKELEKLARDVQKALDRLHAQDVKKVRQEMEKLAASHGVSVEEVLGAPAKPGKATKAAKSPSKPKYANPADPSQTWTGKGRKPDWFHAAIKSGATAESLAI